MNNSQDSKFIPGFSNYRLTKNNVVINIKTGNTIHPSMGNAGYPTYTLISDSGERTSIGLHRLLCLVYKPIANPENYQVDHLNGDKMDNRIENLEWCTSRDNTIRAGYTGLSPKSIPVEARNVKTGEILQFDTFTACGEYFGLSKDAISDRANAYPTIYPGYWQFRRRCDDAWTIPSVNLDSIPSIYTPQKYDKQKRIEQTSKKILLRETTNQNTVHSFSSMSELAKFLNVKNGTITRWLKSNNQPIVSNYYQLKMNDGSDWIDTDPYLGLAETTGQQPVVVVNDTTGESTIYKSIAELARAENISANQAYSKATSCGSKVYNGFRYWIYSSYVKRGSCPDN